MNNPKSQAILARDMIDMIEEFSDNADVLEYVDSFASQIATIVGKEAVIDWLALASICDAHWYPLSQGQASTLDTQQLAELKVQLQPYLPPSSLPSV